MLALMADKITRLVCGDIKKPDVLMFSVIVDGTRDITGVEQELLHKLTLATPVSFYVVVN